jgi:integrase
MATVTKRGGRWFAQVRRQGHQHLHRTFSTKGEALRWAREQEAQMDGRAAVPEWRALKRTTLRCVVQRYLAEVTPKKRSQETERLRLGKLMRHPICDLPLDKLTPAALAAYRDHRLVSVKPGTVRRELSLIHHALDVSGREWGLRLPTNPVSLVRQPLLNNARDRRLERGDAERLANALAECRNPLINAAVWLAIETGLRRAELLGLEWRYINTEQRTAYIPWSKTGRSRTIPLTGAALKILDDLEGSSTGRVFPMTANALRLSWQRVRNRAGLKELRFHDLRHEALSRFAEMGLNLPELAVISGHRDARMLLRYTHVQPSALALKLSRLTGAL